MDALSWIQDSFPTYTAALTVAAWWISLIFRKVANRQARGRNADLQAREWILLGAALIGFLPVLGESFGGALGAWRRLPEFLLGAGLLWGVFRLPGLVWRGSLLLFSILELHLLGPRDNPRQRWRSLSYLLTVLVVGTGLYMTWGSSSFFGLLALAAAINVGMARLVFRAIEVGGPFQEEELS